MKNLLQEEKRSTVLFIWLFFIVLFTYDIFYYYLFPRFPWYANDTINPIWYYFMFVRYVVFTSLIPVSIYLMKRDKAEMVKYMLLFSYVLINFVSDALYYKDSPETFSSGNFVEVVIILFSPIFVNKRFTYIASTSIILKYALLGLFLQNLNILFPVILMLTLSFIAYLLLNRFLNYIKALKQSYSEQMVGMVRGVIATLELKDPYTRGHSERVAAYAMSLAKATEKFAPAELTDFYYACLLHDIGKVSIPDSILAKNGRLTDEEYDIIKTHPVVGANAVRDVEGIADNLAVISHHHERWDGKGYPDQLAGENIPLRARITAVADAFDAMTSSRSYRPALPFEEAYERILAGKGSQFDPQLVDIFKQIYPEWVQISKTYRKSRGGESHENPQAK